MNYTYISISALGNVDRRLIIIAKGIAHFPYPESSSRLFISYVIGKGKDGLHYAIAGYNKIARIQI